MNVLFLSLSFSTKEHKSFYEDLLRVFVEKDDNVYVACAKERKSTERVGVENHEGLTVLRVGTGNMTGNISIVEKGISTVTIDFMFMKAVKKYFGDIKFDLIMYPTPPITLVNTIEYVKKRTGARTYLLLKDIFPQNAVDLGMMKKTGLKGLLYKYFRRKEKKLYRISDYIGCMSPANCDYVLKHNPEVNNEKVEVCPNCVVPLNEVCDKEQRGEIRKQYGIPVDKTIFVYGGNLGKPQGIEFLLDCINVCRDIKDVYFLIVGGGAKAEKVRRFIAEENVQNAKYIEKLPKDEYSKLVRACDVGMVFLDYRFTIPNFPSRILSYMNAAMPVIVATDPNTDMGDIVVNNGFGWKCYSNDAEEFVLCVEKALNADCTKMGEKGRKYLKENYHVKNGYDIIIKHFN